MKNTEDQLAQNYEQYRKNADELGVVPRTLSEWLVGLALISVSQAKLYKRIVIIENPEVCEYYTIMVMALGYDTLRKGLDELYAEIDEVDDEDEEINVGDMFEIVKRIFPLNEIIEAEHFVSN